MANRNSRFLLKRSNVPGKVPTSGQLKLGELALNTADVILYTSGTTQNQIVPIGWDRCSISGDTLLGKLQYSQDFSPFTGNEIPSAQWVLDQVSTGATDVYVTGMTWNSTGNTLTLERNDGVTITENINITNIEGDLTISGKTIGDSIFKNWAQWYRYDNSIYTVTPVSTPIKVGTQFTGDTFSDNSKGFTYSAGTLTFNGSETQQQFHLTVSMTAEASANNQLYDFWISVNGVQLNNIVIANELGTKKESISLTGIVPLSPGDYMELYIRNNTANKDILLNSINFSAIQI